MNPPASASATGDATRDIGEPQAMPAQHDRRLTELRLVDDAGCDPPTPSRQAEENLGTLPSARVDAKDYITVQRVEGAREADWGTVDTGDRTSDLGRDPVITEQHQLQGSGPQDHAHNAPILAHGSVARTQTRRSLAGMSGMRRSLSVAAGIALGAVVMLLEAPTPLFIATVAVLSLMLVLPMIVQPRRTVRVAVLGTTECATALATELDLCGVRKYEVVGRIAPRACDDDCCDEWTIGSVSDLDRLIDELDIDLILMGNGGARMEIFDAMTGTGARPHARLWELAAFYEEVFGHIPISEINNAWFQCVLHPKYRPTPAPIKRALDVAVAFTVSLFALPLLLALAWLVRRDGGPALFRQVRIGEGSKPFTMFKLRTMSVHAAGDVAWSSRDDARVTKAGRFLRRSHLDELPQLVNVLRGEMSIVGPRPEQPQLVEQLEATIPFYSRRHQIRPGITGWAQVRCGYAGSESGTTWKLCHDLYYLKHRTIALDLRIMLRTGLAVVADRQWREARSTTFVQTPAAAAAAAHEAALRKSALPALETPAGAGALGAALPIAFETSASHS